MSDPVATVDDLALYLNDPISDDDTPRAQFILDMAHELCETIIDPLPAQARSVVLDVAQRGYVNPVSVRNSTSALYVEDQGPFSDGTPGFTSGGLWLTGENRTVLRRLSGGGGAFTVDLLAGYCPPELPIWDVSTTQETLLEEE